MGISAIVSPWYRLSHWTWNHELPCHACTTSSCSCGVGSYLDCRKVCRGREERDSIPQANKHSPPCNVCPQSWIETDAPGVACVLWRKSCGGMNGRPHHFAGVVERPINDSSSLREQVLLFPRDRSKAVSLWSLSAGSRSSPPSVSIRKILRVVGPSSLWSAMGTLSNLQTLSRMSIASWHSGEAFRRV